VKLIRFPRSDEDDGAQTRERAYLEAEVGKRLRHRNIVKVTYSGEITLSDANGPYVAYIIATEFVRGRNLRDVLRKQGAIPLNVAVEIMRQLLDGLAYAHANGIDAHRDIKPANIMLTNKLTVKILDFGIVRATGRNLTLQATALGTPRYMAAEQFRADMPAGPQTDVYASAAVFWEMLTGFPLRSGNSTQIMHQVLASEIPEMPISVPRELRPVFVRALSAVQSERYRTATAFWDAIRGALPDFDQTQVVTMASSQVQQLGTMPDVAYPDDDLGRQVSASVSNKATHDRSIDHSDEFKKPAGDILTPFRAWYEKAESWARQLGL
jgi:serine/threonine-protein kinase